MADMTAGSLKRATPVGARFDPVFRVLCLTAATTLLAAITGVLISLLIGGWPAFSKFGLKFFTSTVWNPVTEDYGGAGPIVGTLITATLALLIALRFPSGSRSISPNSAAALRRPVGTAVELLAGVPSIVYGMWGLFVLAPLFAKYVELPLMSLAPPGSVWETLFSGVPNGSGLLMASLILAVMIIPYIAATLRELFLTVPVKLRESAYGVGCTSLEVVWSVTLPHVRKSAIGAVMLGLGRALARPWRSPSSSATATAFLPACSTAARRSPPPSPNRVRRGDQRHAHLALLALGFVLFLITFTVLAIARTLLGSKDAA